MRMRSALIVTPTTENVGLEGYLVFPTKFLRKNWLNMDLRVDRRDVGPLDMRGSSVANGQVLYLPGVENAIKYWAVTRYQGSTPMVGEMEIHALLQPADNFAVIRAIDFYKQLKVRV